MLHSAGRWNCAVRDGPLRDRAILLDAAEPDGRGGIARSGVVADCGFPGGGRANSSTDGGLCGCVHRPPFADCFRASSPGARRLLCCDSGDGFGVRAGPSHACLAGLPAGRLSAGADISVSRSMALVRSARRCFPDGVVGGGRFEAGRDEPAWGGLRCLPLFRSHDCSDWGVFCPRVGPVFASSFAGAARLSANLRAGHCALRRCPGNVCSLGRE